MRKRWTFNPVPYIALWGIAGFIALFVVQGLTGGCSTKYPDDCGINGPISTGSIIEVCVWIGPFVLFALGGIVVIGIPAMTKMLWEARPRRIEEPVIEDLREIHPPLS